jgi:hypothetical protein
VNCKLNLLPGRLSGLLLLSSALLLRRAAVGF